MDNEINIIRIYGDSISLPRISDGVSFQDSWPELIKKEFKNQFSVYNRSIWRNTIIKANEIILGDNSYFGDSSENGILVLQLGLCDCAPRPVPENLREKTAKMPKIFLNLWKWALHKYRPQIQKIKFFRYVNEDDFFRIYVNTLQEVVNKFKYIFIINIPPTNFLIEKQSPGLSESIEVYNKLISNAIDTVNNDNIVLVDVNEIISGQLNDDGTNDYILSDGQHLTKKGHNLYSQMIAEKLNNLELAQVQNV